MRDSEYIHSKRVFPLYAEIHGEFLRLPVSVWRVGTYRSHIALTKVGKLHCVTISLFGRRLLDKGW